MSGSQSGLFGAASRLPKYKSADRTNAVAESSIASLDLARFANVTRLATKPGMTLRDEVIGRDRDGGERVVSWRRAVSEWRDWYKTSEKTALVFRTPDGDEVTAPATNRFMPSSSTKLYAKLHDFQRGVKSEYDNLSTAFLTLSASTQSGAGRWNRCPANHLDDLTSAWPAVRRALSRQLQGRQWEYMRMLEPHPGGAGGTVSASGYGHVHLAVFVDGPITEQMFEPVLEAHVRQCNAAGSDAHTTDRALSIQRDVDNLASYLAKYLMKYDGDGPMEAPEHIQMFHSLLWATGTRRWSVSDGAQDWMSAPEPDRDQLELEPVAVEIGGERYAFTRGESHATMREIDGERGRDPPPLRP